MPKQIKIVVGSNFGNEGKGLMTDYFCHELAKDGSKVLNVRYNGGAQAGHNVITPDGKHHSFSHFGAGSFNPNVVTYLSSGFILNPILFCRELDFLKELGLEPTVIINPNCRITTPYDMLVNQILEKARGDERHGSCGMGIDETVKRYESDDSERAFVYLAKTAASISDDFEAFLAIEQKRTVKRLNERGIYDISNEDMDFINSTAIRNFYLNQLKQMMSYCHIDSICIMHRQYDHFVFEGAQGLLLDKDYLRFAPHLTSSKTGSLIPKRIIVDNGLDMVDNSIEVCYVTRPYLTRHGAGPLPTECDKADILGNNISEPHNQPNEFQGAFRYGYFDRDLFINATHTDRNCTMRPRFIHYTYAVTHMDETDGKLLTKNGPLEPSQLFYGKYYESYGPTRDHVRVIG